jgi:trans-aconitate 2-methyltransferase
MPWNPDQYHKFQAERAAPFYDLMALVPPAEGLRVVDLGCGPGELTAALADYLPDSDVLGIDSSPEMLAKAAQYARPGLRFEQGDLATLTGAFDVVFSNAAVQWVEDHARLLPHLWSLVAPGGRIAAQMPSNHHHFSQRVVRELAGTEPYRSALNGFVRLSPVLPVDEYAERLYALGGVDLVVFEKVYPHVLADSDAVVEWTKGTMLIPYMERLSDDLRERFLADYRARLREQYPTEPVFYGFRRILFTAARPE